MTAPAPRTSLAHSSGPRTWWIPVWSAALIVLGCVPLGTAYRGWWVPLLLAGVAVSAFALAALGSLLRIARWLVALAGVTVLAIITSTMASSALESSPAGARSVLPLIDSLPRLLTASRPAPATAALLSPTVLLVGVVALAVALAVTGRRGADSRTTGIAGLVGSIVLQVAAALLVAGQDQQAVLVAIGTLLVASLGWVLAGAQPRSDSGRRHGLVLPGTVAMGAAVTAVVALALPTAGAFEARRYITPPTLPAEAINPVPDVTAWVRGGEVDLFDLTAHGTALPHRVSIAVLPDYDGAMWRLDARLRAPGVVDDPDLLPGRRQAALDLEVEVRDLAGSWLPTLGRVESIEGAAPLADVDTGTLVLADGDAPTNYRLRTVVDAPEEADAERAGVPSALQAARYLELPRVSADLREEAFALTEGSTSRLEQARRLADGIREGRELDVAAVSGSSYGRLAEFLFLPREEGGARGTQEQFAGSFAVLARTLGIPSRLVVGFEVPDAVVTDGATSTVTVTGADASIWAEIYLADIGWIAFDPSPDAASSTGQGPGASPMPSLAPLDQIEAAEPDEPETLRDDVPASEGTREGASLTGLFGVVAAVVVLPLLALALLRGRRRSRLRRAGARGAWQHVADAAWLAGLESGPGVDARTLAREVVHAGADPEVRQLAASAEHDAFAPEGPDATGSQSAHDWAVASRAALALRRSVPWRQRLWWDISPAVLRRR